MRPTPLVSFAVIKPMLLMAMRLMVFPLAFAGMWVGLDGLALLQPKHNPSFEPSAKISFRTAGIEYANIDSAGVFHSTTRLEPNTNPRIDLGPSTRYMTGGAVWATSKGELHWRRPDGTDVALGASNTSGALHRTDQYVALGHSPVSLRTIPGGL